MVRQNQGSYTLPRHLWCRFSYLTWLKQPWLDPRKAEAKHSRSPTQQKLPQWKLSMKKTQHRGSDKKPSMLETGSENQFGRKLMQLSLRCQKTSGWGRKSSPLCLEGNMANKILIPLQSRISCFLEPPSHGQAAVGSIEGLWRGYSPVCPKGSTILCTLVVLPKGVGILLSLIFVPRIGPMKTVSIVQVFSRFSSKL